MKYRTINLAHNVPALVLAATDRKVLRAIKAYAPHLDSEDHRAEVVRFMEEVELFQRENPDLVGELKTAIDHGLVDIDELAAVALKKETDALMAGEHSPTFEVLGIAESTNVWIFRNEDGSPYRVRKEIQVYNSRREAREAFDALPEKKQGRLEIHKTVAVLGR